MIKNISVALLFVCCLFIGASHAYVERGETIMMLDTSHHSVVTSYNADADILTLRVQVVAETSLHLILSNTDSDHAIKLWRPQTVQKGVYQTQLALAEVPQGTYLLHVVTDNTVTKQVVFK